MMNSNLAGLVRKAKAVLSGLSVGIEWEASSWDVGKWLPTIQTVHRNHKLVFGIGNVRSNRPFTPLPPIYSDFAKAIIVMIWSSRNLSFGRLSNYMRALRLLSDALSRRGTQNPCDIKLSDLEGLIASQQAKTITFVYLAGFASTVKAIASEMDYHGITNPPLDFIHPFRCEGHRRARASKSGQSVDGREEERKLPSMQAIAAYAKCTNDPIDDNERILLRACDLQIVLGNRINETLLIPKNCLVEETVKGSDGLPLRNPTTGDIVKRHGIRLYPEKGYKFMINWLPDQDVPIIQRAVKELADLCEPARKRAKWLETHPGKLWPYKSTDNISTSKLLTYFPGATRPALSRKLWSRGISPIKKGVRWAHQRDSMYKAGDIETTFAIDPKSLTPMTGPRGQTILCLSDCLAVKFEGQFSLNADWQNNLRPEIIKYHDIATALGGNKQRARLSIFERRGLKDRTADGKPCPFTINTHSARHWKNTLYDQGGMSDLQQTWAMHRKSVNQTRTYQHKTLTESTATHRNLLDLSFTEKIQFLKDSIKKGTIHGALTTTYNTLVINDPTTAEEFLRTHAVGIQITPWGICSNDFTLSPCPKYLQCFDNCKHYHRTMDPKEEERLRTFRTSMTRALGIMRGNAAGEAGGDKWIKMLEEKMANIDRALSIQLIQIQPTRSVPPFPNGIDKSKHPTPRRTVVD
ncbi:MAG: hypothetical protein H8K09_04005 [Nitrospira sp.]|nr:hypothetical protein [Nitrospira sp.]